ncbi:hypothetical protein D9758_010852 [Tetrapyrgos nigripes]|uniref:Uncharacterized protein n=1 Tax=Tetrapyrgos nigripes TaxID=182062 RepID=A0A8H5GIP7_9AGAR|nr:hypothetical protein D9758_010852 [Tetrapyrgos nigripes]
MSDSVTIVLDDYLLSLGGDGDFGLVAKGWGSDTCSTYYNTTCCSVNETATEATLIVRSALLNAASWSVFGSTPPAPASYRLTLTTDVSRGETVEQNVSFQYPHFTSYQFFWTDFVNTDDFRNRTKDQEILFVFPKSPPTNIDYILVEVRNTTSLGGRTILVDDSNSEITWDGDGWVENRFSSPIRLFPDDNLAPETFYLPHYNGTHSSNSEGDSFTFRFQGSFISVQGISPLCRDCQLQMNFTVDSNTTLTTFSSDSITEIGIPHFLYFENQSLQPGNHTMVATITLVQGNTSASIDYLTYKPAFGTVLEKPVFSPPTLQSPPNTPPQTTAPDGPNHRSRTPIIAGSVSASVVVVTLGLLLFWWTRRSWKQRQSIGTIEPFKSLALDPGHSERVKGQVPSQSRNFIVEDSGRKGLPPRVVAVNALPTAAQLAELRSQNEALNRGLESLETRSVQQAPVRENVDFANLVREMRTQVNGISRDISRFVVPPAYESAAEGMDAQRRGGDGEGESAVIVSHSARQRDGDSVIEDGQENSMEDSANQNEIEVHLREIRARMGAISRDINRYIAPPAYETDNGMED